MNLISDQKCRAKIIQHLLQNDQPSNNVQNTDSNLSDNTSLEQVSQIELIKDAQQKKARICDEITYSHKAHYSVASKPSSHAGKKRGQATRSSKNEKNTKVTKTVEKSDLPKTKRDLSQYSDRHLTSQKYHYHQKNLHNIGAFGTEEFHVNKQNEFSRVNIKSQSVQLSTKKYRFIEAAKVQEVLSTRRREQEKNNLEPKSQEEDKTVTEEQDPKESGQSSFQSVGSSEKVQQNQDQIRSQTKELIEQEAVEKSNIIFEIEIELEQNVKRKIQMTKDSDPQLVARDFIRDNSELIDRKGFKSVRKLQSLLSQEIHQKIIRESNNLSSNKYKQFLKNKYQKLIAEGRNSQRQKAEQKISPKKSNYFVNVEQMKPLEYTHVYVEQYNSVSNQDSEHQAKKQTAEGHNIQIDSREEVLSKNRDQSFENSATEQEQCIGAIKLLSKSRSKSRIKKPRDISFIELEKPSGRAAVHSPYSQIKEKSEPFEFEDPYHQIQNSSEIEKQQLLSNERKKDQEGQLNEKKETQYLKMNKVSEEIVKRLGKSNILQSLKQKENQKVRKIIDEKQYQQQKELKECSFQPRINKLSKNIERNRKKMNISQLLKHEGENSHESFGCTQKVKEGQNQFQLATEEKRSLAREQGTNEQRYERFQNLYDDHKLISAKKEYKRQKSLEQISFKPQINPISQKIIQSKKNSRSNSLSNSRSHTKHQTNPHDQLSSTMYIERSSKDRFHLNCKQDQSMSSSFLAKRRKTAENFTRNTEGLEIGDYLYKEAVRLNRKKNSLMQSKPNVENFRPLEASEKLSHELKCRRLSEYFDDLIFFGDTCQQQQLFPDTINLNDELFRENPLKLFVPLIQELQELGVSLNREEFIGSGLRLMNILAQAEKAELLSRKHEKKYTETEAASPKIEVNPISNELMERKQYHLTDIYSRGLLQKKRRSVKVESTIEQKVRQELEDCTFNPRINARMKRM